MNSKFGELHKKAFNGEEIKAGGAPDMGSGFYAR
jgi:hypothetical protein